MTRRACLTCVRWDQLGHPEPHLPPFDPETSDLGSLGTCQARPPAMLPLGDGNSTSRWPVTHRDRFCGWWSDGSDDWEPDGGPDGGSTADILPFEKAAA